MSAPPDERRAVRLLALAQLVAMVDFTMILSLGPDLARPLDFPESSLPLLAAAYALSAALVGVVGARRFDRVDRVRAQVLAFAAVAAAAVAAALATSFGWVLLARLVAGAAGGPAIALGQTILVDVVPESRRGRAMGVVLGANAVAGVLAVPFGLQLAQWAGWRAPFVVLAVAALGVAAVLARGLAALPRPTPPAGAAPPARALLRRPLVVPSYLLVGLLVFATFLLAPNLSAFGQRNLDIARERLPVLYAVGGAVSVVTVSFVGRRVDRHGARWIGTLAILTFAAFAALFLLAPTPPLPAALGFVLLLASLSSRNVAVRTLATRVPAPEERGRFMSLQSAVQHVATAAGAATSAALLSSAPDGRLVGMPAVAALSIALSIALVPLLHAIERRLGPTDPSASSSSS